MRSLALTAALFCVAATGASAQEAMSTAGASGNPPAAETARQIDAWIAASPGARDEEQSVVNSFGRPRDGRIHGQVELGVGTGGYRSGSITTVAPIGDSGTLMLHFGQSKNDYRYWMDGYRLRDGRPLLP